MKSAEKRLWIYEQRSRYLDAVATLDAAKRQAVSAYDSRLRKLHSFEEVLRVKNSDTAQLEMFDTRELMNPDIENLLDVPLNGL